MKSAIKCFKATYIVDIFYGITTPTKFSQRWVEGFNSFKIDTGRLFTGYDDNRRRTLETALQYKSGGIPLSQLESIENVEVKEYYK